MLQVAFVPWIYVCVCWVWPVVPVYTCWLWLDSVVLRNECHYVLPVSTGRKYPVTLTLSFSSVTIILLCQSCCIPLSYYYATVMLSTLSWYIATIIRLCPCHNALPLLGYFATVRLSFFPLSCSCVTHTALWVSYCLTSHAAFQSHANLPLWSCLQLSSDFAAVELLCHSHAALHLWSCFKLPLWCYFTTVMWLAAVVLLCHLSCFAPHITPWPLS